MRTLWLHLRNSPVRWALPVLIALDLAILFLRTRYWVGVWPETGAAAQVPAYLLGVLGAGAGGGGAGCPLPPPARHATAEQLDAARVRPAVIEAYRMAATIVLLLVPYLVGQAAGFVVTARTFPPGLHLWLGYFALGIFAILLAVVVGWTVGKIFGPMLAALLASLAFLVLLGLLDRQGSAIVVTGRPFVVVDSAVLAFRLGIVAVVLVVLLWVPSFGRLRGRHLTLPAIATALLFVVLLTTSIVIPREPAEGRASCVSGPTRLCIWPEHEKYLPQLKDVNLRIAALPEAFVVPPQINEFGIDRGLQYGDQVDLRLENPAAAPYFQIIEGSPWSFAGGIASAISAATFRFQDSDNCAWHPVSEADMSRLAILGAWLEAYLAGEAIPDFQTDAPPQVQDDWARGRAMLSIASAEQFRWAEGEVNEIRGRYCGTSGR
jgi:hypothetical protein